MFGQNTYIEKLQIDTEHLCSSSDKGTVRSVDSFHGPFMVLRKKSLRGQIMPPCTANSLVADGGPTMTRMGRVSIQLNHQLSPENEESSILRFI
jgi:hypothetical protein